MSLAITALIEPSCLLRRALVGYALACFGVGAAMLAWPRFHFSELGAAACLLAALAATRAAGRGKMTRQIDISGPGQIRLTVQHGIGGATGPAEVVVLLPGSTIWPHCLLLLLGDAHSGALHTLVILPDSLPLDTFRNVSIALRAIARRDNKFFENNKIL